MPDRMNIFVKSDATAWSSSSPSKANSNLLQIVSGSLSNIKPGEVIQAVVQKAGNGAFKISLNGESIIIKGLPASMLGKKVSFIIQQAGQQAGSKAELFWLGNSATEAKKAPQPRQQQLSQLSLGKHANVLSALPNGLSAGKTLSGRIDAIEAKQMRLTASVQDGKISGNTTVTMQISKINGMQVGDVINGKLVSTGNNQTMLEIISPQRPSDNPSKLGNRMASFKMVVGDTATAFVQQRLANGNVQLNIQGITVETAAPATINKGDALSLKMIKAPAGFQVVSVHKNAAVTALNSFKANLPMNNQPVAQNIAAMRTILPNLSINDSLASPALPQLDSALKASEINAQQPLNGERLAHMIRDGGSGLESKLLQLSQNPSLSPALQQDLKAIMLQLTKLQHGNSPQHELINTLRELSQQSVSRIESGQALNVLTSLQGEPMRLELPMLVNQQMVNVQLAIQQQGGYESDSADKSSASDESYNILFALDLSQLGHIRVDANISDSTVHARIYNDNPASNQFIADNIQRLESRLQGLGFNEVYLLSSQQQPEASKQQSFDQLTQMMPHAASLNLVDIRI